MNSGIISFIRTNFPVFLFITPLGWTTEKKIFINYYWFSKDTNSKWHRFEKNVNKKFNINIFFINTLKPNKDYIYTCIGFGIKEPRRKIAHLFDSHFLEFDFIFGDDLIFLIKSLVAKSVKVNGVKETTLENT